MNDPFEWSRKLIAFRNGELSDQEREEVETALNASPFWRSLYEELSDTQKTSRELQVLASYDVEKALRKVRRPVQKHRLLWFAGAAAILLLGFLISTLIIDRPERFAFRMPEKQSAHSGVTLSLASGEVLDLDTLKSFSSGNGLKLSNAEKMLTIAGKPIQQSRVEKPVLNRLDVPIGMTYAMMLPDGTQVWLNAGSNLEFPSAFDGAERKVKISGEAFFKVHHDERHPFIVENNGEQVLVLGTTFNIKAYSDEAMTYTTLINGSIAFKDHFGHYSQIQPGEQLSYNRSGRVAEIRSVQTEQYTAWKDGLFWFEDAPLEDIMRRVGRWYGLDVVFEQSSLKKELYSGKMKMYDSVEDVLRKFNKSGGLKFIKDGHDIRVLRVSSN